MPRGLLDRHYALKTLRDTDPYGVSISSLRNVDYTGVQDTRSKFNDIQSALNGSGAIHVWGGTYRIASDFTFTRPVVIHHDGMIKADSGVTVTFNAGMSAGRYQTFTGDGNFVFGERQEVVYADYFGHSSSASASVNDIACMKAAASLTSGMELILGDGQFAHNHLVLILPSRCKLTVFSTINAQSHVGAAVCIGPYAVSTVDDAAYASGYGNDLIVDLNLIMHRANDAASFDQSTAFTQDETIVATCNSTTGLITTATAHGLQTGDPFWLTSTIAVPSSLTASKVYWAILSDTTNVYPASSYENAINGTALALGDNGSGTIQLWHEGAIGLKTTVVRDTRRFSAGQISWFNKGFCPESYSVGFYSNEVYLGRLITNRHNLHIEGGTTSAAETINANRWYGGDLNMQRDLTIGNKKDAHHVYINAQTSDRGTSQKVRASANDTWQLFQLMSKSDYNGAGTDDEKYKLTVTSNNRFYSGERIDEVFALTGGSLPSGLSGSTNYWVYRTGGGVYLASSLANYQSQTWVDLGSNSTASCGIAIAHRMAAGDKLTNIAGTTLPSGIDARWYFGIPISPSKFYIASSRKNAIDRTKLTFTAAGSSEDITVQIGAGATNGTRPQHNMFFGPTIQSAEEVTNDANNVPTGNVTVTDNGDGTYDLQAATSWSTLELVFTADAATDTLTTANSGVSGYHGYVTGELIPALYTTGALPAGLAVATNYYAIYVDDQSIKVASSEVNALAGTAIDITDAGTGAHTMPASVLHKTCHITDDRGNPKRDSGFGRCVSYAPDTNTLVVANWYGKPPESGDTEYIVKASTVAFFDNGINTRVWDPYLEDAGIFFNCQWSNKSRLASGYKVSGDEVGEAKGDHNLDIGFEADVSGGQLRNPRNADYRIYQDQNMYWEIYDVFRNILMRITNSQFTEFAGIRGLDGTTAFPIQDVQQMFIASGLNLNSNSHIDANLSSLALAAAQSMYFHIDSDDDDANNRSFFFGHNNDGVLGNYEELMRLDETGLLSLEGMPAVGTKIYYVKEDDFDGLTVNENNARWTLAATQDGAGTNTATHSPNNQGTVALALSAVDNGEWSELSWNDDLDLTVAAGLVVEFLAKVGTQGTGVSAVFGLGSARANDYDAITYNCWFKLVTGSQTLRVESDDNAAVDSDDNSTGVGMVADTYYRLKIDCSDLSAVTFYRDNVALTPTLDWSAAAGNTVQVFVGVKKDSGTGTQTVTVDDIKIQTTRS